MHGNKGKLRIPKVKGRQILNFIRIYTLFSFDEDLKML